MDISRIGTAVQRLKLRMGYKYKIRGALVTAKGKMIRSKVGFSGRPQAYRCSSLKYIESWLNHTSRFRDVNWIPKGFT